MSLTQLTDLQPTNIKVTGIATFDQTVGIAGTLTYEDVTNVDSVGILTARSGIHVTGVGSLVGIGTNNPDRIFHISTASPIIKLTDTDNSLSAEINGSSGNIYFDTHNNNRDIIFRGSTNEVARITGDGKVGIGTQQPSHELDIESTSPVIEMKDNDAGDSRFQIAQSGTQTYLDMDVGNLGSSSLRFRFAGQEKLRIDSSGHIGIGTDNPAASLQGNWNKILEVSAGIHTGSMIRFTESGVGGGANKGMLIGEHDNNAYLINYQNGFLQFRTNGLDRGRFDAAGRLLIGDSSVEGWSPDADDFTISNAGANCGMTIRSAASGYSSIFFSDATSGTGEYDGFLQYGHTNQQLDIGTASASKFRILSNGHVTTLGNNIGNPVGMELKNENTAAYSHAELTLTSQNTTSSKIWCDIPNARMRFQYNGGTTVGIDQSGNVQLANGSGISFSASGNFGTMDSEILDDYEEGYWTPTIGGHVSNGSSTYGNQKGSYVRVGGIVHLNWYISWTNTTASGQFRIHGLPFNSASTYGTNYNITTGSMMFDNINVPYQYGQMVPYFSHSTNQLVFYSSYHTGGWSILNHDSYTQNGGSMICSITYRGA